MYTYIYNIYTRVRSHTVNENLLVFKFLAFFVWRFSRLFVHKELHIWMVASLQTASYIRLAHNVNHLYGTLNIPNFTSNCHLLSPHILIRFILSNTYGKISLYIM